MLVINHDDACWITMMKMLVNYICICAYMLLVKFPYMLLAMSWWCKYVLKYVDVDVVMTLNWIVICWLCGRKYLIMQLLLKWVNVNGGYPLYCRRICMRWFCIVESLLVCPCIIVMLSRWCCKRVYFYFVELML